MKYAYEDLGDAKFEELVLHLCYELFGFGVQGFATGPDGGRDALFIGDAEKYPSATAPWKGTTIIQAKHTLGHGKSFSENDFYSANSNSSIIAKEIPRIKKLRQSGELDHYILFANRKLTAGANKKITEAISEQCDIPLESVRLIGVESIESWMKIFPKIAQNIDINPLDFPLIISPDDIAEVVEALGEHKEQIGKTPPPEPSPRVPYEKKNKINNMKPEYAEEQRKRFLKETGIVSSFLSAPENTELKSIYDEVVTELQLKLLSKKHDHHYFDEAMEHVYEVLISRDPVLKSKKTLTRLILFYMYWTCDIGESEHATAQ